MPRPMDDHAQSNPERRGESHDGEILAPRTECEVVAPAPAQLRAQWWLPESGPGRFEPPVSALGPLFRYRLERIHRCRVGFAVDINTRPTARVLGGYYKSRRLVRVYSHDRKDGRRPLEEIFDTFLHE